MARKQYSLFPEIAGRVLGFRQVQLLALIRSDIAERGKPRSYKAMADALGMPEKHYAFQVVTRLEARGLVQRPRNGLPWQVRELPAREIGGTIAP